MVQSQNYYDKIRGFRLLSMQSRWDDNRFIDKNIDFVLDIIKDESNYTTGSRIFKRDCYL